MGPKIRLDKTSKHGLARVVLHLPIQLTEVPGNLSHYFNPLEEPTDQHALTTLSASGSEVAEAFKNVSGLGELRFTSHSVRFYIGGAFNELDVTLEAIRKLYDILDAETLIIFHAGVEKACSQNNLYDSIKDHYGF